MHRIRILYWEMAEWFAFKLHSVLTGNLIKQSISNLFRTGRLDATFHFSLTWGAHDVADHSIRQGDLLTNLISIWLFHDEINQHFNDKEVRWRIQAVLQCNDNDTVRSIEQPMSWHGGVMIKSTSTQFRHLFNNMVNEGSFFDRGFYASPQTALDLDKKAKSRFKQHSVLTIRYSKALTH